MIRYLDVYFKNTKAGILGQDTDGTLTFLYDTDYLQSGGATAFSFSMPLRQERYSDQVVRPFFSGLLPDEGARQRLAGALGLSSGNAFGLLEVIGGECAGALSLYRTGEAPAADDDDGIEELTSERLTQLIGKLRGRPLLGGEEGVRLSLADLAARLAAIGAKLGLTGNIAKSPRPNVKEPKSMVAGISTFSKSIHQAVEDKLAADPGLKKQWEDVSGRFHVVYAQPETAFKTVNVDAMPALQRYRLLAPDVTLDITLTDRNVDIVDEGFDIAFRIGELPDSRLIARPLAPYRMMICAAPEYLARRGEPDHPGTLANHDAVGFSPAARSPWKLARGNEEVEVSPLISVTVKSGQAVRTAARAGLG